MVHKFKQKFTTGKNIKFLSLIYQRRTIKYLQYLIKNLQLRLKFFIKQKICGYANKHSFKIQNHQLKHTKIARNQNNINNKFFVKKNKHKKISKSSSAISRKGIYSTKLKNLPSINYFIHKTYS